MISMKPLKGKAKDMSKVSLAIMLFGMQALFIGIALVFSEPYIYLILNMCSAAVALMFIVYNRLMN